MIFLLVGHTHNKLDRFFSRVAVALAGRDYFTVSGMLSHVQKQLRYCDMQSDHLAQVWHWKALLELPCTRSMHNLDPAHAFRFSRSNGIYVQWKQWCTDEPWSKPLLLVPPCEILILGAFRPECHVMAFPSEGQAILDWINRLEAWCAGHPAGAYQGYEAEFHWLRQAATHNLPGAYTPGWTVADLLQDLRRLPGQRPDGPVAPSAFPSDIITHLFPGADIPSIPTNALVKIDGLTHTPGGRAIRSNVIHPGSPMVIRVPQETLVHNQAAPFLVAVAVETGSRQARAQQVVVVWYLPRMAPAETFRQGNKGS